MPPWDKYQDRHAVRPASVAGSAVGPADSQIRRAVHAGNVRGPYF